MVPFLDPQFAPFQGAKFLAVSLSRRLPDLHVVPRLCGQTASPASQVAQGLTRCNAGTCQVSIKLLNFHEIQIPCRLIYMICKIFFA